MSEKAPSRQSAVAVEALSVVKISIVAFVVSVVSRLRLCVFHSRLHSAVVLSSSTAVVVVHARFLPLPVGAVYVVA